MTFKQLTRTFFCAKEFQKLSKKQTSNYIIEHLQKELFKV